VTTHAHKSVTECLNQQCTYRLLMEHPAVGVHVTSSLVTQ